MAKGVDLRSTAGNCAWVRTPQLTLLVIFMHHFFSAEPNLFFATQFRPDLSELWFVLGRLQATSKDPRATKDFLKVARKAISGRTQYFVRFSALLSF